MGEPSSDDRRDLARQLFNQTWDLIDREERSDDDDLSMLLAATASRWCWSESGGPEELSTGDWQVAHVASLLGLGDLALFFARHNLHIAESEGWRGWRLASAHEGMARACAAAGDGSGRDDHLRRARQALDDEPDAEDREAIDAQLGTVPEVT
jgi:hypothetical protein